MAFLRLQANSSVWLARFIDADGKKKSRSTGTRDRRQAQKIADAYEAAATRKFTVSHVQRTLRELMEDATGTPMPGSTVREYFLSFVAKSRVENAESTWQFYEYNSRCFLEWCAANLPLGGGTQMASVQPSHLEEFRIARLQMVGVATVNHGMKFLRQTFARAARAGLLLESPAANIGRIKKHVPAEIRAFSLPEIHSLLAIANEEWRSLILFGIYTGQRLGDLAKLNWRQLDMRRGEWVFTTGKTKKLLVLPLAIPLITLLAETPLLERTGPVHPHAAHVFERDRKVGKLSTEFRRLLARVGLVVPEPKHRKKVSGDADPSRKKERAEVCFHSLRHTATSMLRDAGAPVGVAMELIGHDSPTVHRHYAHLGTDTLRRAVSLLPTL